MLLQHITTYPSPWQVQASAGVIATGRGMCFSERKSNLFNDKKYWPGRCHR